MLTCYVVGQGAVALAACELLLQARYELRGVTSFDGSLREFATRHGIPHFDTKRALEERLLGDAFDYLFSVNNPWIIPREVIRAAHKGVINFHDSPLPKYAGLHATSWALIHGEVAHATTWHEVTEEIDAGRIYATVPFSIGPDDTALTLNTRVLELTVASFRTLIERLARGDTTTTPQPAVRGSYFGRHDRPEAACLLDLTRGHEKLRDLVRALQFGHAPNPLGTAKVQIAPERYASVGRLRPVGHASGLPGHVVEIHDGALIVSVGDADVELSGLTTLAGDHLTAAELRAALDGRNALPLANAREREAIGAHNFRLCAAETRWVDRLLAARPTRHPQAAVARGPLSVTLDALHGVSEGELLAAFAAYLVRVTGADDFDLGLGTELPAAARGLFSEVVPLKVSLTAERGAERFASFAERLRSGLAIARRDVGFAEDVLPRFPALRASLPALPAYPIAFTSSEEPVKGAELTLHHRDGMAPRLASAHLSAQELARAAEHITRLSEAARREAGCALQDLPLMGAAEARQLDAWNDTARPFASETTVHVLFEAQADRTPDARAVSFGDDVLTYAELDGRANQLAHVLVARGVTPGSLVGLCLPRSVDLLVAMLGILKAGAAYVPIDPTYPEKRVEYLVEDSGVALVVTRGTLAKRFFTRVEALALEAPETLHGVSAERLAEKSGPAAPIYVIYTSGSTGNPKGAIISHRALINHSSAIADKYALHAESRMLQSASISFDVAAEQIYPVLLRGGEVVVRPDDLLESFSRFGEFARERAITAMILPTAFWHEWTAYMDGAGETAPESLRSLSVGTEKAMAAKLAAWERISGGRVRFFEGYGPTETTVTCTMFELAPGATFAEHDDVPIGRALPNVRLYVLDAFGKRTPVGIPGELYVGGAGVGLGYHRRPELSAERFLLDPFAADGSRMYRTGDLVRFQDDGQLVYIGRIDSQIKIRGFRVELGEIEGALAALPGIEQAVVQPQAGPRGNPQLVAYYVARAGAVVDHAALTARLSAELPEYMVPAAYLRLERLPMTPNLKVDRRALPRVTSSAEARPHVAPATDAERTIAAVWCALFDVPTVSAADDFFDLGGTSLLAIRLFSELDRAFGVKLPMSTLLEANTVQKLAQVVAAPSPRRDGCLIELRAGGERCLFLVHDADGETLLYANLARRLPEGLAVYGIEPRGRGRLSLVHTSVEDMAAHYVRELRQRQPRGPYYLGGLCAGGVLAFEMARQLEAQGERVALLALIESAPPHAAMKTSENAERAGRLKALGGELRLENLGNVAKVVAGKVRNLLRYELSQRVKRTRVRAQFWLLEHAFPAGHGWPEALPVPTTREIYASAERRYTARPVDATLPMVFRAQDGSGDERPFKDLYVDPVFGWRDVLRKEPRVIDVSGGHGECLQEPHAQVIAHAITAALARSEASRDSVLPPRPRSTPPRVVESQDGV